MRPLTVSFSASLCVRLGPERSSRSRLALSSPLVVGRCRGSREEGLRAGPGPAEALASGPGISLSHLADTTEMGLLIYEIKSDM